LLLLLLRRRRRIHGRVCVRTGRRFAQREQLLLYVEAVVSRGRRAGPSKAVGGV